MLKCLGLTALAATLLTQVVHAQSMNVDPDSATAPSLHRAARADSATISPAGGLLGQCDQATELPTNWIFTIDDDFGSTGRNPISFCYMIIAADGTLTPKFCQRQSSPQQLDLLTGKIQLQRNCQLRVFQAQPLTYHDHALNADFLLTINARMSADRSRMTGLLVGFNSATPRASFQATRQK